jgi:DNA-binding CsgD family transcriptional regulator
VRWVSLLESCRLLRSWRYLNPNLFLVSLDSRRRWYRYHHLFRDWLRDEQQLALESEAIGNAKSDHKPMLTVAADLCRAMIEFMARNLREATERFQAILATTSPGAGTIAVYTQGFLGAALFATSGPEAALPHLQQSAADRRRLSINDVGITAQLAAAYTELGNWEEAEAAAIEALSLPVQPGPRHYPYNAAAHYAHAEILGTLTPRELDMLPLMRGDLSIREIGTELYISPNTAKGYAKTIYQKLGVNSRQNAVDTAIAADSTQGGFGRGGCAIPPTRSILLRAPPQSKGPVHVTSVVSHRR